MDQVLKERWIPAFALRPKAFERRVAGMTEGKVFQATD
jgi:hypothetical protein